MSARRGSGVPFLWLAALLLWAPAAGSESQIFSDRSRETGLDFVHFNGMSGELYYSEHVGSGAALFDYDQDGDLDVYLVQGAMLGLDKTVDQAVFPPRHPTPLTDRLYRNDLTTLADGSRTPRFVDVTEASGIRAEGYGMGVIAGDVDNDGWPDLYVNNLGPNQMLRNNGDGTFSDITEATGTGERRWSISSSFVDYDRDGWLDLYVANYLDWSLAVHRPCYSTSGSEDYCGPLSFDFEPDRLYRNQGDGGFADVTRQARIDTDFGSGMGVVSADFNGDGWLDLYVANDGVPNQLWLNQRDGTFVDEALVGGCAVNSLGQPEASMGVVAGDIDGDGSEDLFMTHLTLEGATLYLNDGGGLFRETKKASGLGRISHSFTGFGTVLIDYDSDGWLDLFVANGTVRRIEEQLRQGEPHPLKQRVQLMRNLGEGRFEEIVDPEQPFLAEEHVGRGVAAGDVDNDGDPDLVVVNNAGPVRLLINNLNTGERWTALDARLGWLGREDLGARVGVFRSGGPPLWRRIRTDGSYASSNDPRLLVGVGQGDVDRVRVEWLGGRKQELRRPPRGRYLVLADAVERTAP